jgi:hypothetical protein
MSTASIVGLALAGVVAAATATSAHHAAATLGRVRIPQPVMVGGQLVPPATYDLRLTGDHLKPLPGQSEDAGQQFELIANGQVVARDFAEVMPAPDIPVGTSGGGGAPARVEPLRGGEFLRIAVNRGGERYLIHLALAK